MRARLVFETHNEDGSIRHRRALNRQGPVTLKMVERPDGASRMSLIDGNGRVVAEHYSEGDNWIVLTRLSYASVRIEVA